MTLVFLYVVKYVMEKVYTHFYFKRLNQVYKKNVKEFIKRRDDKMKAFVTKH